MKVDPCRDCGGWGKQYFTHALSGARFSYDCTSCNGTGIASDPRLFAAIMLLSAVLVFGTIFSLVL